MVKKIWNLENLRFQIFIHLPKICYKLDLRLKLKASFFLLYSQIYNGPQYWQNFCSVFLTGCYIAQAVLELLVLLPLPSEDWDYRHESPLLASEILLGH